MHPALVTEVKPSEVHVTTASVLVTRYTYPSRAEEEMKLADQTESKVCLVRHKTIAKYEIKTRHLVKQQPYC